jgi:hypothetical protein
MELVGVNIEVSKNSFEKNAIDLQSSEKLLPLHSEIIKGLMAEWLGRALQKPLQQFESA